MGLLIGILVAFAAIIWVLKRLGRSPAGKSAYIYQSRRTLLTKTERNFYSQLRTQIPVHIAICPKVRLWDVIDCPRHTRTAAAENRIRSKHLDFVLMDMETAAIVAVLELDDWTHQRPRSQRSDDLKTSALASASIPLVRFKVANVYDVAALAQMLREIARRPA